LIQHDSNVHFSDSDITNDVKIASLRTIGKMVIRDSDAAEHLLDCYLLTSLRNLLCTSDVFTKDVCWIIAGVANYQFVKEIINSDLVPLILLIIEHGKGNVRIQAGLAIMAITQQVTKKQLKYLVSLGIIPVLCNMLDSNNIEILKIALTSIGFCLTSTFLWQNPFSELVDECYGRDKIIALTLHSNLSISKRAHCLLLDHFDDCEDIAFPLEGRCI